MTITIPDELRATFEAKAKRFGFASVEAYVVDLVEHDEWIESKVSKSPLTFGTREEFEKLIQAGFESGGAIPVDEAFWAERRRILEEKIAKRNGTYT